MYRRVGLYREEVNVFCEQRMAKFYGGTQVVTKEVNQFLHMGNTALVSDFIGG